MSPAYGSVTASRLPYSGRKPDAARPAHRVHTLLPDYTNALKGSEAMNTARTLLIVDDEENMRHMLKAMVVRHGYAVETAADGAQAMQLLAGRHFDFILCDVRMPGMDGLAFLAAARDDLQESTVIMMSAYGSIDTAIEAMKAGAYDFISKPFKADEVILTLKKAEEREALKRENRQLKQELEGVRGSGGFCRLVTKNPAMQTLLTLAAKAAQYDSTVLITGESGTGKELMARGIHEASPRRDKPFIAINCGGIPANLLESELFGFVKGAFTGADREKKGLFAEAEGGTLFLDEMGELPLSLQVKLLRVLQEREIRPLGANATRKIDVRILAATARNLADDVRKGKFREDLFFRLNVINIHIPPLRERIDDIPLLCRHFLEKFAKTLGIPGKEISREVMKVFYRYNWPGNVRELENVIHRAIVMADGQAINLEDLAPHMKWARISENFPEDEQDFSLKHAQEVMEERMIVRALTETGGNRLHASRLLDISYPSLLSKIKKYAVILK